MLNFNYRALTANGAVVDGIPKAPTADFVVERVSSLRFLTIDGNVAASARAAPAPRRACPRGDDVTAFSRQSGAVVCHGRRVNDALDPMAGNHEPSPMRSIATELSKALLLSRSRAEAFDARPEAFLRPYAPLRYLAFLLAAASGVLIAYLIFVLPKFSGVLGDLRVNPDTVLGTVLALSNAFREDGPIYPSVTAVIVLAFVFVLRRLAVCSYLIEQAASDLRCSSSTLQS